MKRALGVLLLWALAATDAAAAMDSADRLLFANGLYRRGLHELALPEFEALLADPAATNAHDTAAFRIAECQRALGRTNEAAASFARVASDYPDSTFVPWALFRQGELEWQAGRLRDAARRFNTLLDRAPEPELASSALYHLALCESGLDRFDRAEKALQRLVKEYPDAPQADYGRIALADLADRRAPDTPEAAALLQAVADAPDTPELGAEALAKLGLLHYRAGRHAAAADTFGALADRYPGDPWTTRTRLEAGWANLTDGRTDTARTLAEAGLNEATTDERGSWLYLAANIERNAGHDEAALERYGHLLAEAPGHERASAAAYEACGIAWRLERHRRVLELAPRARGPSDREAPLLWMEAGAHLALGDADAARTAYRRIVDEFPASDRAAGAAYQLARIAAEAGDAAGAAAAFAAVATNHPTHPLAADALFAAGATWQRAGRADEAAAAYGELSERFPDHPAIDEAQMGRARAELELGREPAARRALDAVTATSTNERLLAEALYLTGTLEENAGRFAEAETAYAQALTHEPPEHLARQIQFRRVAVLQRQDRNAEAAALMNGLMRDGAGSTLPPPLLEWLARWNLEQRAYAEAETAAAWLATQADNDGWRLLGHYIAGVAARAQDKPDAAKAAFAQAAGIDRTTRENVDASVQLGDLALAADQAGEAIDHFTRAAERAGSDELMDLRARSYLGLGRAHEMLGQLEEATRYYLSVGVLFDDPEITPESLFRAAGALEARGLAGQRDRVLAELRQRYSGSDWTRQAGERWP